MLNKYTDADIEALHERLKMLADLVLELAQSVSNLASQVLRISASRLNKVLEENK